MCEHNNEGYEKTFRKNGIDRIGLYCGECHKLWDYYPQYNED